MKVTQSNLVAYTIEEHIHRYAVWAAARAVQRNFTTTAIIRYAIERTKLRTLNSRSGIDTPEAYDKFHRQTCKALVKAFEAKDVPCEFGRAAKIVAIYLKTTVVVRDSGESRLAKIIHPPIDRFLLHRLHEEHDEFKLKDLNWTQLDETTYYKLIKDLRAYYGACFWKIEKLWLPF